MTREPVNLEQFAWLNPPDDVLVTGDAVEFITKPDTDFWQRTHYGFRRANGHALLTRLWDDFSFTVQVEFFYENLFDQGGIMLYQDDDNWAKASCEYGGGTLPSMLGSVVTTDGWSDWASTPLVPDVSRLYFRLSRKGNDFRIDSSRDGDHFHQMRIFHMRHDIADTKVGIYACSPGMSRFKVRFDEMLVGPSQWHDH